MNEGKEMTREDLIEELKKTPRGEQAVKCFELYENAARDTQLLTELLLQEDEDKLLAASAKFMALLIQENRVSDIQRYAKYVVKGILSEKEA